MIQAVRNAASKFTGLIGYSNTGANYYDALKDTGSRRRLTPFKIRHEDNKLRDRDRRQLGARIDQIYDNNSIMSWMVRKHVNFTASLRWKPITSNQRFNDDLEDWYRWWSRPQNCHSQERHSFQHLIRQMERGRFTRGDIFILKVGGATEQRGKIQLVEDYRISTPIDMEQKGGYDLPSHGATSVRQARKDNAAGSTDFQTGRFANGVELDRWGRHRRYAVHRATMDGSLQFERFVNSENMIQLGYFHRPDMVRGVSPLTSALNTLEDIYEAYSLIFGKLKLSQTLAAFITRDADTSLDPSSIRAHKDANRDGIPDSGFEMEFDDGVNVFDLRPGEGIETVQDNTTSAEANEYLKMMIGTALKAANIPFSFYSEDFTNWYGARGALNQYRKDMKPNVDTLTCALDQILMWRVEMAIATGEVEMPSGMEIEDIDWDWVPEGLGWFDPVKEANGYKAAIAAGLDSPKRIARVLGGDWKQNLKDIAEFNKVAEQMGVPVDNAISSSSQYGDPTTEEEEEEDAGTEEADDELPEEPENESQQDENE